MRNFLLMLFLLLGSWVGIFAQGPGRNPDPSTTMTGSDLNRERDEQADDVNRRANALGLVEKFPVKTDEERKVFLQRIQPLYRETTKEEMQILAPNSEDVEKYSTFLKQKNTGLTKLIADKGCASNPDIVKTSPQCEGYTMPGAGSAYSFRIQDYRILDLSDLNFRKNRLESLGVLNHGIMVNLGDVSLESITLESNGVKYLAKLKPANDFNKAAELAQNLTKGITDGGFNYSSISTAVENSTYIIRVIAYRGVSPKTIAGIAYNENDLDKREDIIIAFRVVRLIPNESVTILWKELQSKKSPELKPNK